MPRGLSSQASRMRGWTEFIGLVEGGMFSGRGAARRDISTSCDLVCCGLEARGSRRDVDDEGASWKEKLGDQIAHNVYGWYMPFAKEAVKYVPEERGTSERKGYKKGYMCSCLQRPSVQGFPIVTNSISSRKPALSSSKKTDLSVEGPWRARAARRRLLGVS